jgi:regulator of sigma E protease
MAVILGGIAAFFVLMAVVVGIHEGGHFLAGRLFGLTIHHFSIGFGRPLLKYTSPRSGTLYALRMLPLGGAVAIPATGQKSLATLTTPQKIFFYAAGPLANVILGFTIFAALHSADIIRPTPPIVAGFTANSPAQRAGVAIGDRLVAVDGFKISSWMDLMLVTALAPPDSTADLEVERQGTRQTMPVLRNGRFLGITGAMQPQASTLSQSFWLAVNDIRTNLSQIVTVPRMLIYYGRSPVSAFSGPVGVANAAGQAAASSHPLLDLALLIAAFSCGIAAANLLPIPIMDGGRIVQALLERTFRAKTSERIEKALAYTSIAILLTLLVITTSNDIARALHRPEFF